VVGAVGWAMTSVRPLEVWWLSLFGCAGRPTRGQKLQKIDRSGTPGPSMGGRPSRLLTLTTKTSSSRRPPPAPPNSAGPQDLERAPRPGARGKGSTGSSTPEALPRPGFRLRGVRASSGSSPPQAPPGRRRTRSSCASPRPMRPGPTRSRRTSDRCGSSPGRIRTIAAIPRRPEPCTPTWAGATPTSPHLDVLAAQREERARIPSEMGIRWGGRPRPRQPSRAQR
jgi:hypothetical protein